MSFINNQHDFSEDCDICLEPRFEQDSAKLTPCNHIFHKECILVWFSQQRHCVEDKKLFRTISCPKCRNMNPELTDLTTGKDIWLPTQHYSIRRFIDSQWTPFMTDVEYPLLSQEAIHAIQPLLYDISEGDVFSSEDEIRDFVMSDWLDDVEPVADFAPFDLLQIRNGGLHIRAFYFAYVIKWAQHEDLVAEGSCDEILRVMESFQVPEGVCYIV